MRSTTDEGNAMMLLNQSKPQRPVHSMKAWHAVSALGIAATAVLLGSSVALAAPASTNFDFHAPNVTGGSGSLAFNGAGNFNATSGVLDVHGHFKCTSTVSSGPLGGCMSNQGGQWVSTLALRSTPFKCTATDPAGVKTATIADDTAVLQAHFFRAGDGNTASFTANVIVSQHDIAPDIAGVQNVWVQGVGCATASVHMH
jgi:hypothetical protein